MTLLLTEIHCLDGLSHSCVIFAADRRISRSGKYDGTRKKVYGSDLVFLQEALSGVTRG